MADDNATAAAGGSGNNGNGGGAGGMSSDANLPEPQNDVLSLAQLIGAPIHALVDAEAQAAMATARFIRAVGFTGSSDGGAQGDGSMGDLGDLQMARFTRR
jgi:hypothetical protein